MSELKVYHHELRHNEYEEFYLKYEADKREVTATERAEALATIPDLPAGWMQEEREWMLHKNPKRLEHKQEKKF